MAQVLNLKAWCSGSRLCSFHLLCVCVCVCVCVCRKRNNNEMLSEFYMTDQRWDPLSLKTQ